MVGTSWYAGEKLHCLYTVRLSVLQGTEKLSELGMRGTFYNIWVILKSPVGRISTCGIQDSFPE